MNEVWVLKLEVDEWSDGNGIQGYYSSEEKAWKAAVELFVTYKDYRVHKNFDPKFQKWFFWYYTSMYDCFHVEKIEVQ